MRDFLYEYAREMSSGDTGVDQLNMTRLGMQPEYWALIDYLVEKGILNEEEFAGFLGRHFKAQVEAFNRVARERGSE